MNSRNGLFTKLATGVAALAFVLGVQVATASASVLQIQVSGLNVVYNGGAGGGTLCDAATCAGGVGDHTQADPVVTVAFLVDGNLVGSVLTSNIWVDFATNVLAAISANPGPATTATNGGIFDILTQPGTPGWGLALDLGAGQLNTNPGTAAFTGSAVVSGIFNQNLPFGLAIGTPIRIAFSMNVLTPPTTSGTPGNPDYIVTHAEAAGTAEVFGQAVPEPASLLLLGTGLAYGARRLRRRSA